MSKKPVESPTVKVDISQVGRDYLRALVEQDHPTPTPQLYRATLDQVTQQTWDAFYDLAHGTIYQRAVRESDDLDALAMSADKLEQRAVAVADAAVKALLS